ncbi:PR-1-like protein [Ephemerocybe angulata]|uniref:PR-1-like protein n=1 Tax=Ephemerocybe angulata TaxID=980116 RepID=A0A8H6IIU4_9AGAR|nr:PR-1-like protein [Tulosesus angulatus]
MARFLAQLLVAVVAAATMLGASAAPTPSDIQSYLDGHNVIRRTHGAVDLVWDQTLSDAAQRWVNNCRFEHSGGSVGPYGENLAAGSGSFGIRAAIKLWTDEASQYNPSNPVPSHFTQVVWKSTNKVGCAVQTCTGIFPNNVVAQFYACEYSPPGNVIGQFPQNVQV